MSATSRFDGLPIFARKTSTVVEYGVEHLRLGSGWHADAFRSHTWIHEGFGVMLDASTPGRVVVVSMGRSSDADRLRGIFDPLFGGEPRGVRVCPISLRAPVRILDPALLPLTPRRLHRLIPASNVPPRVVRVGGGGEVELRINVTTDGTNAAAFAEAVLGWRHITRDGLPRSLLFRRDALRSPSWTGTDDFARYVSAALVQLVDFIGGEDRVEVEHRDVSDLRVATTRSVAKVDDVAFDVRLPHGDGFLEFVSVPWPPWYAFANNGRVRPQMPEAP